MTCPSARATLSLIGHVGVLFQPWVWPPWLGFTICLCGAGQARPDSIHSSTVVLCVHSGLRLPGAGMTQARCWRQEEAMTK